MKKIIALLLLLGCISAGAQQVYIENGKIITNFKFKTSTGVQIDYLRETTNSIAFGFRAPFDFTGDRLHLGAGMSLNRYGASGTDLANNNTYNWDVNYLAAIIGSEYDVVNLRGFTIYAKAQLSGEFFLQGTQSINGDNYDLRGEEQFDGTKIFIRGGAGVNYAVNDDVAAYVHYLIGRNFFNVGEDKTDGQDLDISTHSVAIGVYFKLKNYSRFK
jgi:opacity protein-like surface antigen